MDENEQQLECYIHQPPLNLFILEDLEEKNKICMRKKTEQIKNNIS
jgi:hypothetical protein